MKRILLMLGWIGICSMLHGQDNRLIYPRAELRSTEKSDAILRKSPANLSVDFVHIDLEKLLHHDQLLLQFGENKFSVRKEQINVRGIRNFGFTAKNEEDHSSLIFSVLDNDIQGTITVRDKVYAIETVGEQEYAIVQLEHSKFREKCDNLHDNHIALNLNSSSSLYENEFDCENSISNEFGEFRSAMAVSDCKIRVLVLYTPAAAAAVSNIKNSVLLAIDETNQSFLNSNINYRVELAYIGATNYMEANIDTDLYRFSTNGDGYMDEVYTLRDKYSADVCLLVNNDSYYCGVAKTIGASANNAFCVVAAYGCMTGYYSFGHEIGHLLGCRHDTYVDPTATPFAYGHGYVSPTGMWRTIMAYGNACGGCTRIQYWSNPNVAYGGISMGTISINNNTRVWNERSNTVMAFRQPANNVVLTNDDVSNSLVAEVIAKQEISTNGTVSVTNNKSLDLRAGNKITLRQGFSLMQGAKFTATLESITDCGFLGDSYDELIGSGEDVTSIYDISRELALNIFPNPAKDIIYVSYELKEEMPVFIEFVNFFGQTVKTVVPYQMQKGGNINIPVTLSELPQGIYFLSISIKGKKMVKKIIIGE